jgi:hypothetical protein
MERLWIEVGREPLNVAIGYLKLSAFKVRRIGHSMIL